MRYEKTLYEREMASNVCCKCGDDMAGPTERDSVCYQCDQGEYEYDGYCRHGNYVGGSGIDYMCRWCEDGVEPPPPEPRVDLIFASRGNAGIMSGMSMIAARQLLYVCKDTGMMFWIVKREDD
jgi:hypothetical protein